MKRQLKILEINSRSTHALAPGQGVLLLLTALLACSLPAGAGLLRSVKHAQREGDEHAAAWLLTEGAQTAQDLLGDAAAERTSDGGATL
jgi:hypothetical protein